MKYSIIIPTYRDTYLNQAIESVLSQNYTDFELVIVDDCSPCNLKAIVDSYDDNRISYYRNPQNYGAYKLVDNWNQCLKLCKGEYIINIGDDDVLLPNCLEEYNKLIARYPDLYVYHARTQIIDKDNQITGLQDVRPVKESFYSMLYHQWHYNRMQFIGDFCFKASWLRDRDGYVFFPYALNSDWATANLAAKEGGGIANGNVVTFQYRRTSSNISSTQDFKTGADTLMAIRDFYKQLLEDEPDSMDDQVFRMLMTREIDDVYRRKLLRYITFDISSSHKSIISNIVYWTRRRKKYNIGMSTLFYSVLRGLHT